MSSMYSTSQMANFYSAFSTGAVRPSGVMNYVQHLLISERCRTGAHVLDMCCGRGLMIPLLAHFAPSIAQYVGVEISHANILEAVRSAGEVAPPFPCRFIRADVSRLPFVSQRSFDVVIYTSSLEHLDKASGALSIDQAVAHMSDGGSLYLSTPHTPRGVGSHVNS